MTLISTERVRQFRERKKKATTRRISIFDPRTVETLIENRFLAEWDEFDDDAIIRGAINMRQWTHAWREWLVLMDKGLEWCSAVNSGEWPLCDPPRSNMWPQVDHLRIRRFPNERLPLVWVGRQRRILGNVYTIFAQCPPPLCCTLTN